MKTAYITGGNSGIGRQIALLCAQQGIGVYIVGRNEEKGVGVVNEIINNGGTAYFSQVDVTSKSDVENTISDAIERFGHLDVVVANAGAGRFANFEDFSDDDYDIQFDTNVKGVFYTLRSALRHMKSRGQGQLVVTSSNLGFKTYARCGLYAATKFAVQAMVGAIREELKGTGVKAATVNPGSVDTPWFDGREVDRSKMLSALDVANAAMLIINQSETSDIDHVLLLPGRS